MPTTAEFADLVLLTAPEHAGWSLVESTKSANCYEELCQWAGRLDYQTWSADFALRKRHLGLVLLWLECEAARRHGGEGKLWPVLSNRQKVPLADYAHTQLFTYEGNATALHRELLRCAAERFSLRHTFDEDDGQNWYRLIYLQFGFTHEDAKQRLPAWLSGQLLPVSVQKLIETRDSGALQFQQIWRSLRMFRLGNLNRAALEARLQNNPWVLPEWCSDLIEAAKRSSAQGLEVADLDAAVVPFFTVPQLCWPDNGSPSFTISLCNLDKLGLEAPEYQLKVGGLVLAKLIRQKDGSYYSDAPEKIPLPLQSVVALSLWSKDGQILAHDEVELWDAGAEVTLYSLLKGAPIPSGDRIIVGTGVLLIASADIIFDPPAASSFDLPLGYRLNRVSKGWMGQLRALLDDDVVWSSAVGARPAGASGSLGTSAYFSQTLDLTAREWVRTNAPWSLPIHFSLPVGWTFERLRWQRADGNLVELKELPKVLSLTEADAISPVVLRVRLAAGTTRKTETLRVPVPFVAALKWNEHDKPYHHAPDHKLLLSEARRRTWSFSLPPAAQGAPRDPRLCSFVEGRLLHSRLKSRRSTLPDLGGYGAPLRILEDPYQDPTPVLEIAPCVVDGGELGKLDWRADGTLLHIKSRLAKLGPEHKLIVWRSSPDGQATVEDLPHEKLLPVEDGWLWPWATNQRLVGVALEFRGTRLGSCFDPHSWSDTIVRTPPSQIEQTARLLRTWKAPLLQSEGGHLGKIMSWLRSHWVSVVPTWVVLQEQAEFNAPQRNWQAVVNELLTDALPMPDVHSTQQLLVALAPRAAGVEAIGAAFWKLAFACPILTARVTRIALGQLPVSARRQFFELLLCSSDFAVSDERAAEIGRSCGNRDGAWLQQTVPSLAAIDETGSTAIKRPYRILAKDQTYRFYVLGRWLREIRQTAK